MSKITVRNNALFLAEQSDAYNTADGNVTNNADDLLILLHEEWVDDGLVRWELDNIPLRAENAATQLLGYELARRNRTVSDIKLANLREGAILGEKTLRRQASTPYNGEPLEGIYF